MSSVEVIRRQPGVCWREVLSGTIDKEGGSLSKPPLLTGPENYDYWKYRMEAFIKSIDSRTWKAVMRGWEPPMVLDKDGKKTDVKKPADEWTKDEDDLALGNSKALRLALERNLKNDILECPSVVEALEYAGLMKTVVGLDKCYDRLVKEFLINVAADCNDPASPEYRQVFVRGKCVQFSPIVINQYLQRSSDEVAPLKATDNKICKVLTGGKIKVWPSKAKLSATSLSPFYAVLNRIAAHNWVPTTHSGDIARGLGKFIYAVGTKANFDYGAYFFQETLSHALTYAVEKPVALPTLLCNIILEQHPDILRSSDVPCKRKGVLVIEQRLLDGTNDAAGVGTSVQAGVLSRKQMIADLTETSRALEARKLKIDRVIEALKAEEAAEMAEGEPDGQEGKEASESEDGSEDVMEDSDETGVMTKREIIAGLKVQCQDIDKQQAELEERKKVFMKMIEGLEADEVPVKASANVAATGDQNNADEDEGYDTATDEDEASDSSDDE
ncbi:unnamed protein product [Trifolium pratense]|uniref:Uncharacterized protein n=1 Tax=Trifolium pratense TaxID=57577 RepID=A0ACB0KXS4_TRIPR|nr:unnamed protein product [Trifolium pratense]